MKHGSGVELVVSVSLVEQRGLKDKMILYEGDLALIRRIPNVVLACDAHGGRSLREHA